MVFIDESRIAAYRNTIRDHKRELKFADAHEASISRKGGMNLEMEQVAAQVDESIFDADCECGHPKRSHFRLDDPGCYHTLGCTCLQYREDEA